MNSDLLSRDEDLEAMRALLRRSSLVSTVVDFEEQILLSGVRGRTRIWRQGGQAVAFAYVDDFHNLRFAFDHACAMPGQVETEIVEWGVACGRDLNTTRGTHDPLDCSCASDDLLCIELLRRHGFASQPVRTLRYSLQLEAGIVPHPPPSGFTIRSVTGEKEVPQLVALHRAAFGTENMTVEQRLAIMRAPAYQPELDLVAVASNGELAAFCICGFEDREKGIGFTDPIGTHPAYRGMGLGLAIVSAGLAALASQGARTAVLGTSSDNVSMRRLAEKSGFVCVGEKLWFSKML